MPPFSSASELGPQVASCGLPAVHLTEQQLCITGLCSTLRFLISCRPQLSQEPNQEILGYQGGCLSAPAEVSTWTKFCEVDEKILTKFRCLGISVLNTKHPRGVVSLKDVRIWKKGQQLF